MIDIIWICWISLVPRVISEAAEKRCTSASENDMTFVNSFVRSSRPIFAPVRDATKPTSVEMTTDPSTKPIILSAMSSSAFICMAFMS